MSSLQGLLCTTFLHSVLIKGSHFRGGLIEGLHSIAVSLSKIICTLDGVLSLEWKQAIKLTGVVVCVCVCVCVCMCVCVCEGDLNSSIDCDSTSIQLGMDS